MTNGLIIVKIFVTGIGFLSSLGSLATAWQHLMAGKSGVRLWQPFPQIERLPLALIGERPAELISLCQTVVRLALQDAELEPPLLNCGVVIGSSRSQQALWEKLARQMYESDYLCSEKLGNWLASLPHASAIATARQIGATGPVLAPMAACATGIWSIAQGFELIQTGQCQQVIAGAVEAPITPLTLAGFRQMGALAETGAYPFDRYREGLVLGEGASILLLESAESALRRKAKIYGEVLGFGLTSDAYHANSPQLGGKSAINAIEQCLKRSHLFPKDIDYIHAHGTATQLNDQNEARIIQHLFPQGVPVSSTKGATGHTLGASGALGAAFCLMALQLQTLPPCVGLRESEFDLDLVTEARSSNLRNLLCFSFGFGGQNAVMALRKTC
ncbi:MAG TPA: beta-ketoacyl-ACP synthase [Leptolyngbyaceae cyanobacterium]